MAYLRPPRRAPADFTEVEDEDEDELNESEPGAFLGIRNRRHSPTGDTRDDYDQHDQQNQDGGGQQSIKRSGLPVLPLFSSSHLDSLPIYHVTHAIRIIVAARTETTLTWEQLRSPQVSQFLVKPTLQQIRTQHFSRATLYALMANCLQFAKEGQLYAASAGNSTTRALICELLALKLLKEYTTRELIDALAYDFYPLQGMPGAPSLNQSGKLMLMASRTSTLEVAIRASAKHFLAHPVVVQQLEAIWSGAITFYSSADRLHRDPSGVHSVDDSGSSTVVDSRTPLLGSLSAKANLSQVSSSRKTVMLYDPRQASLMKLSRLRVPRYRSFLSTLSLAVLIGLFLAVLAQRSAKITALELVFWFWSAGFMLDELVGFNEQGFALYIMSFWNIFDLGILVLLIVYYCMRAYGVFLVDARHWNALAYDVLAANAILLLPRIFSVLDHYQYFSQLLIAFRLMAADLAAVFVLILIACSGFFVFFTLSHNDNDGPEVAYKIFQILMGFSPAAWDMWATGDWLGRSLLVLFLFICHFLVVTILITVLTNSFTRIASNAKEEHQFLFAINTIAMVKDGSLFSYVAPSNIFAWLLMPLRYCMPLKQFVWLNRTTIKITHFPILFAIYAYERFWLAPSVYEPTDLVEQPSRGRLRTISFADPTGRAALFSPNIRTREESTAGFQKDRALEEVFRKIPDAATLRTQRRQERHKTQNAIRSWMDQHDETGTPDAWPTLDSRALPPDWQRRMSMGWDKNSGSRQVSDLRSIASDPADLNMRSQLSRTWLRPGRASRSEYKDHTDADGDDEFITNDEDEDEDDDNASGVASPQEGGEVSTVEQEDYFSTQRQPANSNAPSSLGSYRNIVVPTPRISNQPRTMHTRSVSTNTILYNPEEVPRPSSASSISAPRRSPPKSRGSGRNTGISSPTHAVQRSPPQPRSQYHATTKARPIAAPRGLTENGGVSRTAMLSIDPRNRLSATRRLSSANLSGLSDILHGEDDGNLPLAGSFQTQMAMALMKDSRLQAASGMGAADRDRMGRLVLARMKTLEESFAEMIREMRELKNNSTNSTNPVTRENSSGEDIPGSALPFIEVAGRERVRKRKGDLTPRRPGTARTPTYRGTKEIAVSPLQEIRGQGRSGSEDVAVKDEQTKSDEPSQG